MTLAAHEEHLETDRLLLRRITAQDLPFFERIHADPDVARYLGPGRPRSIEETRAWFQRLMETYEAFGLGQLAVTEKSEGTLIGRCGLAYFEIEPKPADGGSPKGYFVPGEAPADVVTRIEPELGYTFDRTAWGRGFASEAAAGVFAYATGTLAVERVVSIIHPDNARSIRLARAFGATHEDTIRAFDKVVDRYSWPV